MQNFLFFTNVKSMHYNTTNYFLWGKRDESISHIFSNSEYSRSLLLKVTEYLNHAVWKITNSPQSSLTTLTLDCEILLKLARNLHAIVPSWGLPIWSLMNRRLRQHTLRPPEIQLKASKK